MTAEAQAGLSPDTAGLPMLTLDEQQLGDLELLLSGAFAPLTGFMCTADVTAVERAAKLADGTPWPILVTLDVAQDAVSPEPTASCWPTRRAHRWPCSKSPSAVSYPPPIQGRPEGGWSGWAAGSSGAARSSTARSGG